jgi:hypothetical protein
MMRTSLITEMVLIFLPVFILPARAADPPPAPAKTTPKTEAEQIKHIAQRLDVIAPAVINQISFTMIHAGGDHDGFMKAIGSPDPHGKDFSFASAVQKAGGLAKYRLRVAALLKDESPVTRGYGAQWLGMVGDESCKDDLLKLLKTKPAANSKDGIEGFDREMAAAALGMLGIKESAPDLAKLLQDPNARVRAGAATAIGIMKEKKYADAIAKSLEYQSEFDPRSEEAYAGAILALVALDAKQHAPTIAKQLANSEAADYALFALVALNAKEQTKDIAAMLKDDMKGGDASVALALMGAADYADAIGGLLRKNKDFGFMGCKTAIALGILRANQYAPDIANLMKSSKDYERQTAAWALILLENKKYAAEALAVIGPDGEKSIYSATWLPDHGAEMVENQLDETATRAIKSYRKMRKQVEENKSPSIK